MKRAAALVLAALAGCAPLCADGTLFLDLSFPEQLAAADLDVVLSLDGAPEQHQPLPRSRPARSDSVAVVIPGYAEGAQLSVRVDAVVNDVRIGSGAAVFTLAPSCTRGSLVLADVSCPAPGGGETWVDPDNGSDDQRYGGGPGLCAHRTLTYALQHDGVIHLAPAVYRAPDEALPFVLTGKQVLDCDHATLVGAGTSYQLGLELTVVLAGEANQLRGCTIVGEGKGPSVCVLVDQPATAGRHLIDRCDISRCPTTLVKGSAIQVEIGADPVTIRDCFVHDAFAGIMWDGGDHPGGVMVSNTFEAIRVVDIVCTAGTAPGLTGSGSQHSLGVRSCDSCVGCPF